MKLEANTEAFFAFLRAGLWEKKARLSKFRDIDFSAIMQLAEEQSVVGLVTAGLEQVKDAQVPQEWLLQFIGATLQIEQRNKAMNEFVARLINDLRDKDVYSILMKGQGIAQCYEKPLWRACGDVDLLLNGGHFDKAQEWLLTIGQRIEEDKKYKKHSELQVGQWVVELHGTMRGEVKRSIDYVIDEAQEDVFYNGKVRSWQNGRTTVFLPSPDNDVIFVFTHILQHFFREGVGVRQICDWCRLMWTYRTEIDVKLLEKRLKAAGIVSEWRAFAVVAVKWLGMPLEAMPLYSDSAKWERKAERIIDYVLELGNFGHNRDLKYKMTSSFAKRMMISLGRRTHDFIAQAQVFPIDAIRAYYGVWKTGMGVVGRNLLHVNGLV